MLHSAQCIVKTSLLIHRSMQSADTAVHLCAFRWRFLLQAPSLLQGTSISAPCLLLTCSSPHRMLPCKLLPCKLQHKIARGRWRGDGSLGSWNGSGWFWICRADLKFSHSCKVWDYNLVALCSLQVQTSKWSRMKLKNKSCLSFQVWLSSRCSADPRPTSLVQAVLQRCCWQGWCWCHLFW